MGFFWFGGCVDDLWYDFIEIVGVSIVGCVVGDYDG